MAGNPNVNPFVAPVKVPFQKTVTTSQRGVGVTSGTVNDPAWNKWTQNTGQTLEAAIAQINVIDTVIAQMQASFATITQLGTLYSGIMSPGPDWQVCDGTAISRTTYAALFALSAGNPSFGPGDGSTTFNVPTCGNPGGVVGLNFYMRII
jgi:hypothetical protein